MVISKRVIARELRPKAVTNLILLRLEISERGWGGGEWRQLCGVPDVGHDVQILP